MRHFVLKDIPITGFSALDEGNRSIAEAGDRILEDKIEGIGKGGLRAEVAQFIRLAEAHIEHESRFFKATCDNRVDWRSRYFTSILVKLKIATEQPAPSRQKLVKNCVREWLEEHFDNGPYKEHRVYILDHPEDTLH